MKTGLLRETVGMITMNIRVFDLGVLERLATLLGNKPEYVKEAVTMTIDTQFEYGEWDLLTDNWMWDGVMMVQDRESACDACHANGLLRDLVTQIGELDPGTQKRFGPILNEIDMFLTANEHAFNENLDGNQVPEMTDAITVDAETFKYVEQLDDIAYGGTEDGSCYMFEPQALKNLLDDIAGNDDLTKVEQYLLEVVNRALLNDDASLYIWNGGE